MPQLPFFLVFFSANLSGSDDFVLFHWMEMLLYSHMFDAIFQI